LEPYLAENTSIFLRELFLKLNQLFVRKKVPHSRQSKQGFRGIKQEVNPLQPSFLEKTGEWKETKQGSQVVIEFEEEPISSSSSSSSSLPLSSSSSHSSGRIETIDLID